VNADAAAGGLPLDRDFNVRFDAGAWPALAPVRSRIVPRGCGVAAGCRRALNAIRCIADAGNS
jgi:hypothetical protein